MLPCVWVVGHLQALSVSPTHPLLPTPQAVLALDSVGTPVHQEKLLLWSHSVLGGCQQWASLTWPSETARRVLTPLRGTHWACVHVSSWEQALCLFFGAGW